MRGSSRPSRDRAVRAKRAGGRIGSWQLSGTADLRPLQCRLDDTGDADGDAVPQLEDVFERAAEAVGPEMRPCFGLDELRGDPPRPPAFSTEPSSR